MNLSLLRTLQSWKPKHWLIHNSKDPALPSPHSQLSFKLLSIITTPHKGKQRSSMAMENCLRVTTVGTGARPQCLLHPFSSRGKLVFPTFTGCKKSLSKSALSKASPLYSAAGGNRKSRFICNAREAVNEGDTALCWFLPFYCLFFTHTKKYSSFFDIHGFPV